MVPPRVAIALLLLLAGCERAGPSVVVAPTERPSTPTAVRTVVRVLDGDSAVLDGDEQVRLLGIDAPEQHEPISAEARAFHRSWVEGRAVRLEPDVEARDGYGRLLAWVWVRPPQGRGPEVLLNAVLVEQGLARMYLHPPNVRHETELREAQESARAARRGVWALPGPAAAAYYLASRSAQRFHRPDCEHVAAIPAPNRIRFDTRDAALATGRSPCRTCKPRRSPMRRRRRGHP